MRIILLTETGRAGELADALRSAGQAVRELDGVDGLEDGVDSSLPDAILAFGTEPPPVVRAIRDSDRAVCAIALVDRPDLLGWKPDPAWADFVVRPWRPVEIMARVSLHLSRARRADDDAIEAGPLRIDSANYTVSVHRERIELTYKEFELLRFLASHPGRVFTRDSLLQHVWGYDYWGGSRTIDVHIRRIRSKLPDQVAAMIETVHQVGYRFATPKGP